MASITLDSIRGRESSNRNLVINGAMAVAQRSTSVTGKTSSGYFTCDRWNVNIDTIGTWSFDQSSTVPSGEGFATSLKASCTTADASPAAGDSIFVQQKFEGQNLQQLKKGTSNAESVTVSFWVRSSKTGIHIVELRDDINTRHFSKAYSITTANTWQYVTLTFDGDTTGTLTNSNIRVLDLNFWLGCGTNFTSGTLPTTWAASVNANRAVGQVNLADSDTNEWYITGVQMEVGTVATPFEHRSFGEELARCQRYYQLVDGGVGKVTGLNSTVQIMVQSAFDMRATPSLAVTTLRVTDCTAADYNDATVTVGATNVNLRGGRMNLGMSSTAAVGTVVMLLGTGTNAAPVQLSAEL